MCLVILFLRKQTFPDLFQGVADQNVREGGGLHSGNFFFLSTSGNEKIHTIRYYWYYQRIRAVVFVVRGGTQDKKMSKGHLPRDIYHQVYNVYYEGKR